MKLQLHYRPFEDTRWELFGRSDIEHHALAVLSYINFCTDTDTVKKNIKMCPNQKSWFNNSVRKLLKARAAALESGDSRAPIKGRPKETYQRCCTCTTQMPYKRYEDDFRDNNHCNMWRGIRITTVPRPPLIPPCQANLTHSLPRLRTTQTKDHHAFPPHKGTATYHSSVSGQAGSAEQH